VTKEPSQRQRVAMGRRAIVRSPAVFLMDEPLSNLDAKLRGPRDYRLTGRYLAVRATWPCGLLGRAGYLAVRAISPTKH